METLRSRAWPWALLRVCAGPLREPRRARRPRALGVPRRDDFRTRCERAELPAWTRGAVSVPELRRHDGGRRVRTRAGPRLGALQAAGRIAARRVRNVARLLRDRLPGRVPRAGPGRLPSAH